MAFAKVYKFNQALKVGSESDLPALDSAADC